MHSSNINQSLLKNLAFSSNASLDPRAEPPAHMPKHVPGHVVPLPLDCNLKSLDIAVVCQAGPVFHSVPDVVIQRVQVGG